MNAQAWAADGVVYAALLAVVWVLRVRLLRGPRRPQRDDRRYVNHWTAGAAGVATYLTGVGVLHQLQVVGALVGWILYAAGVGVVWLGLRSLRRFIQVRESDGSNAPGQGPEVSDK
jgi:hypothetical protein